MEADNIGLTASTILGAAPSVQEVSCGYSEVSRKFVDKAHIQLLEYFEGKRQRFDLTFSLSARPFQRLSWDYLCTIPYACRVTYKQQAQALGGVKYCRAVGMANSRNPLHIFIPCHRVVASSGGLGGFAAGLLVKEKLLRHESQVMAGKDIQ